MKNGFIARAYHAIVYVFIAVTLCTAKPAAAHPDIILEYRLLFNFQGVNVNAIGESWTFDETFSQELISDFDLDHDGTFTPSESDALGRDVLGNLSKVNYFTYIKTGGKLIKGLRPFGFKATVQKGVVTFTFGLRLPTVLDLTRTNLSVEIKDLDLSIETLLATDDAVSLRGATTGRCSYRAGDKPDDGYFGQLIVPQGIDGSCK